MLRTALLSAACSRAAGLLCTSMLSTKRNGRAAPSACSTLARTFELGRDEDADADAALAALCCRGQALGADQLGARLGEKVLHLALQIGRGNGLAGARQQEIVGSAPRAHLGERGAQLRQLGDRAPEVREPLAELGDLLRAAGMERLERRQHRDIGERQEKAEDAERE